MYLAFGRQQSSGPNRRFLQSSRPAGISPVSAHYVRPVVGAAEFVPLLAGQRHQHRLGPVTLVAVAVELRNGSVQLHVQPRRVAVVLKLQVPHPAAGERLSRATQDQSVKTLGVDREHTGRATAQMSCDKGVHCGGRHVLYFVYIVVFCRPSG